MNTSKVAVVASAAIGKILSIIGYGFGSLMLLVLLFGLPEEDAVAVAIILLIFIAISVWFVIKGMQIKKRIKRFKNYVSLISLQQMTSLENIAASTSQSIDFVRADLQKMINKKFFANASIDLKANEIIIGSNKSTMSVQAQSVAPSELESFTCLSCGARGTKQKGIAGSCDYCGSAV